MPEAAMHKYDLSSTWQNDVRLSGQILAMETEAVAHRVQESPNTHLGSGVLAFDGLHDAPTLFWGPRIHIGSLSGMLWGSNLYQTITEAHLCPSQFWAKTPLSSLTLLNVCCEGR